MPSRQPARGRRYKLLRFCVSCHSYHGRPQQPVFQLVPALQFLEHVLIFFIFRVHHLDCLVQMRIERLALRRDRPQP